MPPDPWRAVECADQTAASAKQAPDASPNLGASAVGTPGRAESLDRAPVCPMSLAVPCIPPAAAARSTGADRNMLRLLGT
jgi:hypothetical protein